VTEAVPDVTEAVPDVTEAVPDVTEAVPDEKRNIQRFAGSLASSICA